MLNKKLVRYLETNIIPLYNKLDLAHRIDHVENVIESSLIIAKDYNVNLDMVYTISVFHDLGLLFDRENHHIIGGEMLGSDPFVINFFNEEEVRTMKEAVEDHRASNEQIPRTIYGLIISEADLYDSPLKIIQRSFLFRISKGERDFEKLFFEVENHIRNKYGTKGYLKSHLSSKRVLDMLLELQRLLENKSEFKKISLIVYQNIMEKEL